MLHFLLNYILPIYTIQVGINTSDKSIINTAEHFKSAVNDDEVRSLQQIRNIYT